jgi:hypothetical protein
MSIITAERVSALAVEILARTVVLPSRVSRIPATDWPGSGGKTLVRVPQRRAATEFTGTINYGSIDEDPVEVEVSRWYDAVTLTTDETTLEIVEFGRQVIAPMTRAIVEAGENALAAEMNALTPEQDWTDLTDPDATRDDVLLMREALTTAGNPLAGRTLAVAPDVASAILRILAKANEAGSPEELRNGVIGRLFGFDVVESPVLEPGSGVAFHSSGFAFATLSPALPQGGASAASSVVDGIALRTVFAYDTSTGSDAILLDTYGGAALVSNEEDSDAEVAAENGPRAVRFGGGSS